MTDFFVKTVNMSITAGILVAVVLILRLLLRGAPKWISVLLWGLVAVRLICPFSLESSLSLIPKTDWVTSESRLSQVDLSYDITPDIIPDEVISQSPTKNNITVEYPTELTQTVIRKKINLTLVLSYIWILGMIGMAAYMAVSYFRVYLRTKNSVPLLDNIRVCHIESPFVFGIVKPKICLPTKLDETSFDYIIAHERAHIRRGDHLWKLIGFLLLAVHWFNPLIWVGYILLCRDIEMACDERVIRNMDDSERANYSAALLANSINNRTVTACPLAFGEIGVKERIKTVLNYKKPAFWIVIFALIGTVAAAICFLTNQPKSEAPITYSKYLHLGDATEILHQTAPAKNDSFVSVKFKSTEGPEQLNVIFLYKYENDAQWTVNGEVLLDPDRTISFFVPENAVYRIKAAAVGGADGNVTIELKNDAHYPVDYISRTQTIEDIVNESYAAATESEIWWDLQKDAYSICAYEKNAFISDRIEKYNVLIATLDSKITDIDKSIASLTPYGDLDTAAEIDELSQRKTALEKQLADAQRSSKDLQSSFESSFNYAITIFFPTRNGDVMIGIPWLSQNEKWIMLDPINISANTYYFEQNIVKTQLTLRDVIILSGRGYELTWSDFERYSYTETGSGIHIRVYKIDGKFELWIGGTSLSDAPMYIRLTVKGDHDMNIDIRDGGVEEFIESISSEVPASTAPDETNSDPNFISSDPERPMSYLPLYWFIDMAFDSAEGLAESENIAIDKNSFTLRHHQDGNTVEIRFSEAAASTEEERFISVIIKRDSDGTYTVDEVKSQLE